MGKEVRSVWEELGEKAWTKYIGCKTFKEKIKFSIIL